MTTHRQPPGREREIVQLRRLLALPVPVLGLSAPSGTGKSSLLLGGLVPALREEGRPVAVVRHPREEGVADRLLSDLVEGDLIAGDPVDDGDPLPWRDFVDQLIEIERLAGEAPILVLDQFEDVLRPGAGPARAALGVLLAATAQRRPGIEAPPCRWLLAYRQEFHGEVLAWLRDVLVDAQDAGVAEVETLPHDLSGSDRFHSMPLPPLAKPAPAGDALGDATRVFQAAIEKPLAVTSGNGAQRYPWCFAAGGAERLATAFVEARLARPDAPLTPELQMVLAHLLARADDSVIEVPEDPGGLIERALEDHLRRALESAFPSGTAGAEEADVRTSRARALLALRELAGATGAREEGLPAEVLSRAIGPSGEELLEQLATPLTRLVVAQDAPDGLRYVLSHDRMAEVVVRAVEAEGGGGKLVIDAELLRLRRFVALETALYHSGEAPAPRLPRRHFARIAANTEVLLWDDERRAWWAACRRRRRADRRRAVSWSLVSAAVLALVAFGVWNWATARAEDPVLIANLVWALDYAPARDPTFAARARELRDRVLAPLRRLRPPPPLPEPGDPDWIEIPAGSFLMGTGEDEEGQDDERPRHEVTVSAFRLQRHEITNGEYRRLWPDHQGEEDVPGAGHPARFVSWYEAVTYAAWLGGRLPTEAEWEYAARAGCAHRYCDGEGHETTVDAVAAVYDRRRHLRERFGGTPISFRSPEGGIGTNLHRTRNLGRSLAGSAGMVLFGSQSVCLSPR